MNLSLVKPDKRYLNSYIDAVGEGFVNMQLHFGDWPVEDIKSDIDGYIAFLDKADPFTFETKDGHSFSITQHEIIWLVDTETNRFLGSVALRYDGDKELLESYAGHVGLSVRPSVLQKGYGVRMGGILKELIKNFLTKFPVGTKEIYMTCDQTNAPSRRLMEHFGARLTRHQSSCFGEEPNLIYAITI